MAEYGDAGVGGCDRPTKQIVGGDSSPEHTGVVPELADLGRSLEHERHDIANDPHRTGLVRRIAIAVRDCGDDRRIVEIESMVVDEHVDAGRIPSANLEPVDRRQGLLDREVAGDCPDTRPATCQVRYLAGGSQPIVTDRPERVPECDRLFTQPLEFDRVVVTGFEQQVEIIDIRIEPVEP